MWYTIQVDYTILKICPNCRTFFDANHGNQTRCPDCQSLHKRFVDNLRRRLRDALENNQRAGSVVNDLGCSIQFFKQYLETRFQAGMSWHNYGEWHIDHRKPLASFDLTDRQQFLEACHYTNLQPLWAADNLAKSAN